MLVEDMLKYIPQDWSQMDIYKQRYEMVEVPPHSKEYNFVSDKFRGEYNMGPMYRIQNPFLFTKFRMKNVEYEMRGNCEVLSLFHDTVQSNVESIVTYNIDWRYGERFKYGPGVYFSTSSYRAQLRANRALGSQRAMFLVNVLVGNAHVARTGEFLPDIGYDTVVSPDGETYVKYFDNEFYPTYVQYYTDL